ncbi:MAG: hypothetical protein LBU24_05040 [Methanocalculaceae archaeon]|jgi:Cd2+/Zn2+-exporting ATPase|nr:hypothetical protein [Methanocalculaceae archaeon]
MYRCASLKECGIKKKTECISSIPANFSKKQSKILLRISITFVLFLCILLIQRAGLIENQSSLLVLYLIAYTIIGCEVVLRAKNIVQGNIFDENFLMSIAIIGAFFLASTPKL